MDGELLALLLAIGVPICLRLLDYLLPKGRHFHYVDRISHPDERDDDEPTT